MKAPTLVFIVRGTWGEMTVNKFTARSEIGLALRRRVKNF